MGEKRLGLIGATSLVGECLLPMIKRKGMRVIAFSRSSGNPSKGGIEWRQLSEHPFTGGAEEVIDFWICVAPIWVLPEHFRLLEAHNARRVVALSSTSRFTKGKSSDPGEQELARLLAGGEDALRTWAEARGVEWVILRPTLIYGRGRDKNVTEIMNFISRFGFFPLFGSAKGLRQPVHAEDVAQACLHALEESVGTNYAYNLSGGETLSYREMVGRIFDAIGRRPRLLTVPLWFFHLALMLMHLLPRYRHWTAAMAERMNQDLVFDHSEAAENLKFSPRPFRLDVKDLPASFPGRTG